MMLSRRLALGGLLSALAAPAIIRTHGLLMPIKPLRPPVMTFFADALREKVRLFVQQSEDNILWGEPVEVFPSAPHPIAPQRFIRAAYNVPGEFAGLLSVRCDLTS